MNLEKAHYALQKFFGYSSFRPLQAEIISTILERKDCQVLMPTGSGKSICYQIPAIITEGMCVVVSPLIALMKDQVEGLKANGVRAAFLNSSQNYAVQQTVENLVRNGEIDLLYVSPEKMVTQSFLDFLGGQNIAFFAVDEAHCISQWGHDFRPEYTQLKMLKEQFPQCPVVALTATADRVTRKDISDQLKLQTPKKFIASFDRPNLSLNVLPGRKKFEAILNFLKTRQNQSGIVYCLSRKNTEDLAEKLNRVGLKAGYYHAGMNPQDRSKAQEDFINDNVPIVCATIAFGMGIDKSNVRFVIHYNLPKNMEGYYQEIGRAGRDGLPSDTLLFYSYRDVMVLRDFIEESDQKEIQVNKLQRMQQYAEAFTCRRKMLLSYFSESMPDNCGNCDVCNNPPRHFDGTMLAQKALSAVTRTYEKVSTGLLIDILRGSSRQEVVQNGYHQIKTYGAGKEVSYWDWQQYILQFVNLGLLEIAYEEKQALKLTDLSRPVLFEGKNVNLVSATTKKEMTEAREKLTKTKTKQQEYDEALFEKLRTLRKQIADEKNMAPYLVFHDVALKEMAATKPVTQFDFKNISGVGDQKFQLFGDLFINEVLSFIQQQDEKGLKAKGTTYLVTLNYYQNGMGFEEIAKKRGMAAGTVVGHLIKLKDQGHEIKLLKFVTEEEIERVKKALDTIGEPESITQIFQTMNEEISFEKIKFAMAVLGERETTSIN